MTNQSENSIPVGASDRSGNGAESLATPGPWRLEMSSGSHAHTAWVRAESWGVIAAVGLDPSLPHWDGPQRANARLIAAAPELLEAAQEVLKDLNARIDAAQGRNVPIFRGIASLHAAIAKATGAAS